MNYREYYEKCKEKYSGDTSPSVYDVTVTPCFVQDDVLVNGQGRALEFPDNYSNLISSFALGFRQRVTDRINILQDNPFAIKLNDLWGMPEVAKLASAFQPAMEKNVFGCHSYVEHVHMYRSITTEENPESSWKWHYDDSADEQCKIMVYLSDVTIKDGPFTVIYPPVKIQSSKVGPGETGSQVFPSSRIPGDVIQKWCTTGMEVEPILGDKGTAILFQQNCVHRATVPEQGCHRDIIIYNWRPVGSSRPAMDKRYTYGWDYKGSVKQFETKD